MVFAQMLCAVVIDFYTVQCSRRNQIIQTEEKPGELQDPAETSPRNCTAGPLPATLSLG